MSEIDVQNAKQIRDPMDVLITMTLADDDVNMTYSGYSTAKVADGKLNEPTWSMRKLADLQGDGFPLDGTCALYNPSTTPSQSNGKLGVRSNVGESVSVTATGSKIMAGVRAVVTGAESVTLNGETTTITGESVTLPLLNTTAGMTFNPAYTDRRIEISEVLPEAEFKITNDNLIKATVSLRSDLSIINPTLPESEINIEVYHDEDISEAVAQIPEDVPIIYQAGYPGDMSPERKFYVTGQVTWADNVLSIQGVDAVHFLEDTTIYDILVGYDDNPEEEVFSQDKSTVDNLSGCVRNAIALAGVNYTYDGSGRNYAYSKELSFIIKTQTVRELVKNAMRFFRFNDGLWITYVDAGIPKYSEVKPVAGRSIQESDCANITKNVEPFISSVQFTGSEVTYSGKTFNDQGGSIFSTGFEVGTIDWIYGTGAFLSPDKYVFGYAPRYNGAVFTSVRRDRSDFAAYLPKFAYFGSRLLSPETPDSWLGNYYANILPWTSSGEYNQQALWNSRGLPTSEPQTAQMTGAKMIASVTDESIQVNADGNILPLECSSFEGEIYQADTNGGFEYRAYPYEAIIEVFKRTNRSNVTGSFTWKGDPRMQPRDVVEWERLDGTTETITLENITITHEGGGTMAECTYREGVV